MANPIAECTKPPYPDAAGPRRRCVRPGGHDSWCLTVDGVTFNNTWTEYRTVYQEQPIRFARTYSSSRDLHFQQSDLDYLRHEGKNAWIERRTVTEWERVDGT